MIGVALLSPVLWAVYVAIQVPLWLLGFPVCFALAKLDAVVWELRGVEEDSIAGFWAWEPKWAWLWGNENDGVTGPIWWNERNRKWPRWKRTFVWSAWRNPVNNFHLVPYFHPVIEPSRIRFVGNSDDPASNGASDRKCVEWAFTWQGIYAGVVFRWQITASHHFSSRVGWKLLPKDRFGVTDSDHRKVRCSFATQLHPWRKSA